MMHFALSSLSTRLRKSSCQKIFNLVFPRSEIPGKESGFIYINKYRESFYDVKGLLAERDADFEVSSGI